jgi:glycosyltransferase involved in cell wall biosynthesis
MKYHVSEHIGGAELQADLIGQYLIKNFNHEVLYVYESMKKDERTLKDYGNGSYSLLNYSKLKKIISKEQPDIIYQRCKDIYSVFSSILSRKFGIKNVYNYANDFDYSYQRNHPLSYMKYSSIKKHDAIIAQTKDQYKKLSAYQGLKYQIYNSIEIDRREHAKKENSVIWIGNIRPVKQLERLIPIAEKLVNEDITFYIIGKNYETNYSKDIIKKISKLDNMKYLQNRTISEVNDFLRQGKIFMNTSIREGFPNTFLQAWNHYVPTISINVDPDSIIRKNGLGIVSNDNDKIANYIMTLFNDEQMYNKMMSKVKLYVKSNHDIEKNVEKFDQAFSEITTT